jgi:predicted ABC-type ATPase
MKPRLLIVAGANGAGKSTLTARLKKRFADRLGQLLDPDAIARAHNPTDPSKAAIFAARTVLNALNDGLEQGVRMVYETTMSDRNRHLELIAQAKAQGFQVWVFYVGLGSPERHVRRVKVRAQAGGHDVPGEDVVRRYHRSLANLPAVLRQADRVLIYDNAGRAMRRVVSVKAGRARHVTGTGWWTPALEGLSKDQTLEVLLDSRRTEIDAGKTLTHDEVWEHLED